jgi:hypothetical protein
VLCSGVLLRENIAVPLSPPKKSLQMFRISDSAEKIILFNQLLISVVYIILR